MYEIIYFLIIYIIVVCYYHTLSILFLYFVSIPTFSLKKKFITGFYVIFMSDSMFYLYLQCILRYLVVKLH